MEYTELSNLSVTFGSQNKDDVILSAEGTLKAIAGISSTIEECNANYVELSGAKVLSSLKQETGKIEFGCRNLSVTDICGFVDYGQVIDTLCSNTSCKIWIKNPESTTTICSGDYVNTLSVIKLPIDEYETKVVENSLCDNILYDVSADYIDAYSQDIRDLSTPGVEGTSNAANTLYVDSKTSKTAIIDILKDNLSVLFSNVTLIGKDELGAEHIYNLLSCKFSL